MEKKVELLECIRCKKITEERVLKYPYCSECQKVALDKLLELLIQKKLKEME